MNEPLVCEPAPLSLALANSILSRLSETTIQRLIAAAHEIDIAESSVLMRQGDASDCAYLILSGEMDVCVATAYGEVCLSVVSRGAFIGEIGVFAQLPRTATIRARSATRVLRFDGAQLHQAGEDEPAFLRTIIARLGSQINAFNHAIGLYTNAVSALEQDDFDLGILNALRKPIPELMDFTENFCRMAEQIVHRRAHLAEMTSAAAIQRAILPEEAPPVLAKAGFEIKAHMTPARHVGGDLYDFYSLDDDHIVITIGDVCGKGAPAALFMAVTQTILRMALRNERSLGVELSFANALLAGNNREMMFATLFCAVLELSSGKVTYCNCGHNPPFFMKDDQSAAEPLSSCGPPLGIDEQMTYKESSIVLSPGDRLFFYTDGVTEAENSEEQQFGSDRLLAALLDDGTRSANADVGAVIKSVAEFTSGAPQSDDITCIGLSRSRSGDARQA